MQPTKSDILSLLPPYQDTWVVVTPTQEVSDIIRSMVKSHKEFAGYYDAIAPLFDAGDTETICENLYQFCKQNIRYKEETAADQTTALPTGILTRGHGDCKHYASFIGGVLDAITRTTGKKINWEYCFASYEKAERTPYHVFVIVQTPDGPLWVDPTPGAATKDPVWVITKKVHTGTAVPAKVAGLSCAPCVKAIGATAQQSASSIAATGGALAVIPVAGPFIAAATSLIGVFVSLFGSKYSSSTGVRWLTQLYQYYVLGQGNVTSDNQVNETYTTAAQKWFSTALGVPIYDRYRFDALHGTLPIGTANPTGSDTDRAAMYYQVAPEVKDIPEVAVDQAVQLAKQFQYGTAPGSWKNTLAAPQIATQTSVDANGNMVQTLVPGGAGTTAASGLPWIWIIGGIVALYFLTENDS